MKRAASLSSPSMLGRWLRFNLVGLAGVAVQLAVLQSLLLLTKFDYRVATLMAVEAAVLHNFCWHLRYTWRDRRLHSGGVVGRRLAEFHLTNGAVSLAGSWTLMSLLVGRARISVMVANLITIAACSFVNFLLAEVLVFRRPKHGPQTRKWGWWRRLPLRSCLLGAGKVKFSIPTGPRAGGNHAALPNRWLVDTGTFDTGPGGPDGSATSLRGPSPAVSYQQSRGL